jgi:hypothetical protein
VGRRVVVRFGEKRRRYAELAGLFLTKHFSKIIFQKYIKEKREVQERFENRLKQNFQKLDSLA